MRIVCLDVDFIDTYTTELTYLHIFAYLPTLQTDSNYDFIHFFQIKISI